MIYTCFASLSYIMIYTWFASLSYLYMYACCNIDHRCWNGIYEYWCNEIMTWMYDLDVLLMCDWDCLPRSSTLTWIRLPYSDMLTGLIVKFWHVNSLTLGSVRGPTMWWNMWIVILFLWYYWIYWYYACLQCCNYLFMFTLVG